MNEQPQQAQPQPQQNLQQMNFSSQPGVAFAVPSSDGATKAFSHEQFEARKHYDALASAERNSNNDNGAAPVVAINPSGGGDSNTNAPLQGPYMVLTQVAVPAHMLSQLTKNNSNQVQRQRLQQQQESNNNAGSQPQILSFNQLPPQVQQQILLQQQQRKGQNRSSINCNQQHPQQQQQQQQEQPHLQPQAWKQLPQQQQLQGQQQIPAQQPQQHPRALTMADIQDLLKSNQLDADLVQQLLASQVSRNNCITSHRNQNNSAQATNESSFSDLFNSFNDAANVNNNNGDIANSRLFLETPVQPVQRQNDTFNDDDLFKFFEVENLLGEDSTGSMGMDFLNPTTVPSANKTNEKMPRGIPQFQNISSFIEPTPLFQQGGSNPPLVPFQPSPGAGAPSQVSSSVSRPGMPGISLDPQQQFQQQLGQLLTMSVPSQVPSQAQGPAQGAVPFQAGGTANPTFSLPSTMVPPTVLASVCTGKSTKCFTAKKKAPASKRARRLDTPQDVLMRLVEQQGHPALKRIKSEDAGYDTMPSPLQLSSFGTQVIHAVHTSDVEMLGQLLSCGLSANPCNQFRDSILDLVCKRNNVAIFKCLLDHGSDLRVVDGFGRTPLHHCAWASSFSREIAETIVERDPLQLFIEDKRGQTPMEYVRADIMSEWSEFLEEMADKFWPKGGTAPKLVRPKESRADGILPDPKCAISAGLASMISSGNISVEQFVTMDEATRKSYG